MKVMLEEIERKKKDAEQAQIEQRRREINRLTDRTDVCRGIQRRAHFVVSDWRLESSQSFEHWRQMLLHPLWTL